MTVPPLDADRFRNLLAFLLIGAFIAVLQQPREQAAHFLRGERPAHH